MRERTARVLWALAIGFLLTAGLATAAYLSHSVGAEGIARVLFWQNTLLQNLVPMYNMVLRSDRSTKERC